MECNLCNYPATRDREGGLSLATAIESTFKKISPNCYIFQNGARLML